MKPDKKWVIFGFSSLVVLLIWAASPKVAVIMSKLAGVPIEQVDVEAINRSKEGDIAGHAANFYGMTGTLGDTFGVSTSIFAAATVALVIMGLLFQKEELEKVKVAFEEQTKLTKQQLAFSELQSRIAAIPNLSIKAAIEYDYDATVTGVSLTLYNKGATIYNVKVTVIELVDVEQSIYDLVEKGRLSHLAADQDKSFELLGWPPGRKILGEVRFVDGFGFPNIEPFSIEAGKLESISDFAGKVEKLKSSIIKHHGDVLPKL